MDKAASQERTGAPAPGLFRATIGVWIIVVIAVVLYALSYRFEMDMEGQLGPTFWPRMSLIMLLVGCAMRIIETARELNKGPLAAVKSGAMVNTKRLVAVIGSILGAVVLIEYIGFPLANLVFTAVFLYLVGVRKVRTLALTSVIGTVSLIYLFVKIVYLPLPKGEWFFDDITIAIYRALGVM